METARPARPPLWLIFAITVTGITTNTLIAPSIPDIVAGLAAPRSAAGLIIGVASLPGIVLAPVIGVLADRYGRREVLVPCLVLFGAAGGLGAVAPSVWVLAGLRFLQGVGSAGLINLAVVIIGDHWEGTSRARNIGRNAAVLTACLAVFPSLGGALTDLWGWRAPFLLYPASLLTAWVIARRLPATPTREEGILRQVAEALPYLRSPAVVGTLVLGMSTFALIFGLLLTVLPLYLESRFGLAASWRGVLLGLPALANFAVALNLGRLTARFGRRRLLSVASAIFAVALAVVALAPGLGLVVAGIVGFGLGEGMMIPTLQDLVAGAAPASSRGAVVASFVSAARLGQTAGPVLAGSGVGALGAPLTFAAGAAVAVVMLGGVLVGGGRRAAPAG